MKANINKISKTIGCPDNHNIKLGSVNFMKQGKCNPDKIMDNFKELCEDENSCIVDNKILGCPHDMNIQYSCIPTTTEDEDIIINASQHSGMSTISSAITNSKLYRIKRIEGLDSDSDISLIKNQEDGEEVKPEMEVQVEESTVQIHPISFWDRYKNLIIGILGIVVLCTIIYLLFNMYSKPQTDSIIKLDITSTDKK